MPLVTKPIFVTNGADLNEAVVGVDDFIPSGFVQFFKRHEFLNCLALGKVIFGNVKCSKQCHSLVVGKAVQRQFDVGSEIVGTHISVVGYGEVEHFASNGDTTRHRKLRLVAILGSAYREIERAFLSIGGFFSREHQENVDDEKPDSSDRNSDLGPLFPRWGIVFAPVRI